MPLVLTRRRNQSTTIVINGERVIVDVVRLHGGQVRLAFHAVPHVKIVRTEKLSELVNPPLDETQDIVLPAGGLAGGGEELGLPERPIVAEAVADSPDDELSIVDDQTGDIVGTISIPTYCKCWVE